MIEIKNLKKNFGEKKVLKGINLIVEKGDRIGLIGPSGCGKSTLLRCVNLLEKPTEGEIIFNNNDICKLSDLSNIRRKIGMVFQQFNLFEHLTVLDNITLAPIKLKIMDETTAKKEAIKLLKEIKLDSYANSYPKELSGGQKQRVAIVRTLIMNPDIILFDEPTSALDPEMIGEVTELISTLANNGMTMVIVSHELNFIKSFCNKVAFINDGKILEIGTSKEIFNNPKNEKLKSFLSKIKNK
ncbi:MAG: amino acid ABC transporter ATP-binding protein [Bacilli bacterium]|nr:amino acid ABC transporter ATP-binding protein [Bacilli bacterium]